MQLTKDKKKRKKKEKKESTFIFTWLILRHVPLTQKRLTKAFLNGLRIPQHGDLPSLLCGPARVGLSRKARFGDFLEGDKQAEEPYRLWASRVCTGSVWHINNSSFSLGISGTRNGVWQAAVFAGGERGFLSQPGYHQVGSVLCCSWGRHFVLKFYFVFAILEGASQPETNFWLKIKINKCTSFAHPTAGGIRWLRHWMAARGDWLQLPAVSQSHCWTLKLHY